MEQQFDFCTVKAKTDLSVAAALETPQEKVDIITLTLSWDAALVKQTGDVLTVRAEYPLTACRYRWTPFSTADRRLRAVWMNSVHASNTTCSAPVVCAYNGDDCNSFTFAASEIRKQVTVNCGPDEAGHMVLQLSLPLAQFHNGRAYQLKIYIDRRKIPYYQVLDDVRRWWEETDSIAPMAVPEIARHPMYSTWYSYHQHLGQQELEAELLTAKELGLDSVILDDGWQTDDCGGGYGYCGDWKVACSKFPDLAAHVKTVHQMGMKYLVWFSVPFLGFSAKRYEELKQYSLYTIPRLRCEVLDPRYPAVREFLKETYLSFVKNYQVDGLKLDFIDRLYAQEDDRVKDGMDFDCVQDATVAMLTEIMEALRAYNPDILIEFRQSYIGPSIRRFGNLFRVADCPNDGFCNRIGIADIRLLAGQSAVHSDMLYWNADETVEQAALQVLDCLFGTMQYSLKIENLPPEHIRMSRFWISFMKEHIDLLQTGAFIPTEPQSLYPVITAKNERDVLTAVYVRNKIAEFVPCPGSFYLVNATPQPAICLKTENDVVRNLRVYNCMGDIVSEKQITLQKGLHMLEIPLSGMAELYEALAPTAIL